MYFILRICLVAVGAILLGLTLLCYEDEEKRIQSRIEEYWIRLSYVERPAYESHDRLAKHILAISNHILNLLFGPRYFSWQFISTSVSISSIAALLLPLLSEISEMRWLNACIVVASTGTLVLLAGAGTRGGWHSRLTAIASLPILLLCTAFISYREWPAPNWDFKQAFYYSGAYLILAVIASLAGDIAAIWVFRKISAREFKGWFGVWFGILGSIVAALSMLVVPVVIVFLCLVVLRGFGGVIFGATFLFELVVMDVADFLLIGATFTIAATIAIHHLVWPFVLRTLYSVQRMGFSRIRVAAWSLGLALVGCGIAPSLNLKPVWQLVRRQLGG